MPPTASELVKRAKSEIDLPGFLAMHGWRAVPGKDTARHRFLAGPNGQRILAARAASNHWVWKDVSDPHSKGTIIDACQKLLGLSVGQSYGHLRRSLSSLPPTLPVAGGGASTVLPARRPPRVLRPLGERAFAYLIEQRGLARATVDAFAHRLNSNRDGHMVAAHNAAGDGEERGDGWKSFTGSQSDGYGRGRSVWHARPQGGQLPTLILVAESAIDAMSAWQQLDPGQRSRALLVSTAGSISAAGADKLSRILSKANGQPISREYRGEVALADASDVGEAGTAQREATLIALAQAAGVKYVRVAPEGVKDWNEFLQAAQTPSVRYHCDVSLWLDRSNDADQEEQDNYDAPGDRDCAL